MSPGLAAVAVGIVASALVAVSVREARAAVLGIALTLVLTPVLTASPDSLLPLAARIVAALLAAYVLSIAARGEGMSTGGSSLGWPVEAVAAGAAGVAGFAAGDVGAATIGPPEALGAAFALLVLAAGPVVRARDTIRLTIGLILIVQATSLLRSSLAGSPSALEEAGWALLVAAVAGGGALVAIAGRSVTGSLELAELGRVGVRVRQPDAHPIQVQERAGATIPVRRGRLGLGRRGGDRTSPVATPPTWSVTWTGPEAPPVLAPIPEMEVVPLESEAPPAPVGAEGEPEPGVAAEADAGRPESERSEPAPESGTEQQAVPRSPEPEAAAPASPAAPPEPEPGRGPELAVTPPAPGSSEPAHPRSTDEARPRPRTRVKARSAAGRTARIMPPPDERS